MQNCQELLSQGLKQLQLSLREDALLAYLMLLEKWNKTYNLTAVKTLEAMVTRHALDSLAILPWVFGENILDVGSGPGLPGIPLALALPGKHFTLLDSSGKKTRFLQEVKRQLTLSNVDIVQTRVEQYQPEHLFDTVMTRAFSELSPMIQASEHLLTKNGKWLAMKGRYPKEEVEAIAHPYQVICYDVPGLDAERCCVVIQNI